MAQQPNDVVVTTTQRPEGPPTREDASTEKIRSDIHQTRSELDQTIDELSERLRPRHLLDDLIDMLGEGETGTRTTKVVRGLGKSLFSTIRQHPIPAALIGAGIAWLAAEEPAERAAEQGPGMMDRARETTQAGMAQASEQAAETTERVREAGSAAAERTREMGASAASTASQWAGSVGQSIQSGAGQAAERIREGASSLGQQTQHGYTYSRDAMARTMEDYPLAVGVGLAALGVLAGLAAPRTRREDELMGRTSDRVEEQARSMGRELYERGRQVSEAAMSSAMDEAERQGLSPDQVGEKIGAVAEQTAQTVQDESQHQAQQMQEKHSSSV